MDGTGKKNGFEFSVDEIKKIMSALTGELSDETLDSVSGGNVNNGAVVIGGDGSVSVSGNPVVQASDKSFTDFIKNSNPFGM